MCIIIWPWGPFFEGPEKFLHPKSRSNISSLMISKLFNAHILNMNKGSLHTRSSRRIHLFVFKYQLTKNGFVGLKSFQGFQEMGALDNRHNLRREKAKPLEGVQTVFF